MDLHVYPRYSGLGPHVMATWWTHSDQWHVMMARTMVGLERLWQHVIDKAVQKHDLDDLKIGECWAIQVLPMPASYASMWREALYTSEVQDFRWWVIGLAQSYQRGMGTLPPGVTERQRDDTGDYEMLFASDPHRTWEERFEAACTLYYAERPSAKKAVERYWAPPSGRKALGVSEVSPGATDTPISVVCCDPGHHCKGATVTPLEAFLSPDTSRRDPSVEPVFFFQRLSALSIQGLNEQLQAVRDEQLRQQRYRASQGAARAMGRAERDLEFLRQVLLVS